MPKSWVMLAPLLLAAVVSAGDASAADMSIALGEVVSPHEGAGVDSAALRSAAEGELGNVDQVKLQRLHEKRAVLVSVAVVFATKSPYTCTINATLRDAKTGSMLAIVEGRARAESDANSELRKRVLRAAMRSALSQIPDALAGS